MSLFRFLTTTLVLGLALTAVHAAEGDAIASGAKPTKADAARTAPAVTNRPPIEGPPDCVAVPITPTRLKKLAARRDSAVAKADAPGL